MIVLHYNQLNLVGGVGDLGSVGIDSIVEVPDTYANREVLREIIRRVGRRAVELEAAVQSWKQSNSTLCQGPAFCFYICARVSDVDLKLQMDKFLEAEFADVDPRKPVPAKFIEEPTFNRDFHSTRDNYRINYQKDYDRID